MYTIGEASIRSGVSVPTLRAWERRYGVVTPVRTAAGYRLYDDEAITRLSAMRALVTAGWRPSQAAARAIEVAAAAADAVAPSDPWLAAPHTELAATFVRATAAMDLPALESALDETFGRTTFERAMEDVIAPAMREVGRAWAEGRLDVAAEHAASHALLRRLSALHDASAESAAKPRLLVGLPPGARHELGALAFAIATRRAGIPTLYLGADLPEASWLAALRQTGANVVAVAVPTVADREAAAAVAGAIARYGPVAAVRYGGPAAAEMTVDPGRQLLSRVLPEAVVEVRLALADADHHSQEASGKDQATN